MPAYAGMTANSILTQRALFDIFTQLLVGTGHLARFIRGVDPVLADKSVYLATNSM